MFTDLYNKRLAADMLGTSLISKKMGRDGVVTLSVGVGSAEARVYEPTTEQAANRNLNFARANLAAYLRWQDGAAQRRADEIAEAERIAEQEKELKERELTQRRSLAAYNDQAGTHHPSWASVFFPRPVDQEVVDAWSQLVRHIDNSKTAMR